MTKTLRKVALSLLIGLVIAGMAVPLRAEEVDPQDGKDGRVTCPAGWIYVAGRGCVRIREDDPPPVLSTATSGGWSSLATVIGWGNLAIMTTALVAWQNSSLKP